MKTLYFDCFSGISGDMTIGALLDLGLDLDYLKTELKKLPVEGYELKASRVTRSNLSAMKFDVVMEGQHDHHHHHHHHHEQSQSHFHRRASEILAMIRDSPLNANTKRMAADIFTKLAISEGKVHHIAPEDVEFHEVGAVDSIVDTIGAAIGFDALGIERFLCSAINIGSGFIHCQHGVFPVPAPATADLLRHATIYQKHAQTELVTPTGAAILAAVVNQFGAMDGFSVERTMLDREVVEVDTEYGKVKIKVSKMNGEVVNFAPEYEDCVRIAREKHVPLKRVQALAINAYLNM